MRTYVSMPEDVRKNHQHNDDDGASRVSSCGAIFKRKQNRINKCI